MRISDWSSYVSSSDLHDRRLVNDLAVRQKHRTVDGILKLAHIARPAVTPKRGTCPIRQRPQRLLIHLRELTCEMIAQGLDIVRAFPQRRPLDVDDIETKQEIFTEGPQAHRLAHVEGARRLVADVDGPPTQQEERRVGKE